MKALYRDAETCVIINGVISSPYRVTQGVRQGDPLSCLLFNLAIEPLASMLRNSNLKGYQIPNLREHLKTTLFADDTTVYLCEEDSYEELERILAKWCRASSAKFNSGKTEVIPIGTETYRQKVIETRKINNNDTAVPDSVNIAKDGESVRILSARIGNNVNIHAIWSPVVERIHAELERWDSKHPTMEMRRHIVQMTIGSMTQYLVQVNGMPKQIEKQLNKLQREFIWSVSKSSPVQ